MESTFDTLPNSKESLQSSYDALATAFSDSLHELRVASMLRLEGESTPTKRVNTTYTACYQSPQEKEKVCSLENRLEEIQLFIQKEKLAAKQIQELYGRGALQSLHLDHISSHLQQQPQKPMSQSKSKENQHRIETIDADTEARDDSTPAKADEENSLETQKSELVPEARKKRARAPCRRVDEAEYSTLSSYMTQRIPLSKVNAALEDAASLAEAIRKMLAQVRAGGKTSTQEWRRAQALLIHVASKEVVKGRYWLTEAELKKSATLKADKTGRAIMTILRHLGRVAEVRLVVDGRAESVYILVPAEGQE